MKISLQILVTVLCASGLAFASDYFDTFIKSAPVKCDINIPDPTIKNNLQGIPATPYKQPPTYGSIGYDKTGNPLCPSISHVLTQLVVDIQIGYGYQKRTRREDCLVDKDLDIQFVTCKSPDCQNCKKGYGYNVNRCVPVTNAVTFQAICRPIKSGDSGSYPRKNSGYDNGYGDKYQNGYQTMAYNKKTYKIRQLTVDLPTCCQCQSFSCHSSD